MNNFIYLAAGIKAILRIKLRIENQSVGYRFQAETLLFWESGRHTVAVRSQDCSNSMAPMRGGSGSGVRSGGRRARDALYLDVSFTT